MLIIFDLDDTLIDTSGCLTPVKLEDALRKMVEEGLVIGEQEEALEQLKRLSASAESTRAALAEFLEIQGAEERFLEIGIKEFYENISPEIPVFPFDGVIEILKELGCVHHLALVTIGRPDQQLAKLKKAGIDSAIFSKIAVCERDKGSHYRKIVEELTVPVSEVFVCGDRIRADLAPAKELGFKTIHLKKGRGRTLRTLKNEVDYTISEFSELLELIK